MVVSENEKGESLMLHPDRRIFLRMCAVAVGSLAAPVKGLWANPPSRARAWVTSGSRRFEEIDAQQWQQSQSESNTAIPIGPSKRYQEILGFAAALTDASCYLFNRMNVPDRQALLNPLFGATSLRVSVARTCIGATDYSPTAYSFDEST